MSTKKLCKTTVTIWHTESANDEVGLAADSLHELISQTAEAAWAGAETKHGLSLEAAMADPAWLGSELDLMGLSPDEFGVTLCDGCDRAIPLDTAGWSDGKVMRILCPECRQQFATMVAKQPEQS